MIIAELKGGLGNQLFQYAAAKELADRNGVELFFDIQHFQKSSAWHLEIDKLLKLKFKRKPEDCYEIIEDGFHYQNLTLPGTEKPIFLSGYFQSYKYHGEVKTQLSNAICNLALNNQTRQISNLFQLKNTLGIHIRRGDYLNTSALDVHGIVPEERYVTMINTLSEQHNYDCVIGFSDSVEMLDKIEKEIRIPIVKISAFNLTNIQELQIMTFLNTFIIANSSFSWWGAYLNIRNNPIIYRPEKWFASSELDYNDLCPADWLTY